MALHGLFRHAIPLHMRAATSSLGALARVRPALVPASRRWKTYKTMDPPSLALKRGKKHPTEPKRPMGGYMAFAKAERAQIVEEIGSSDPRIVSRALGLKWKKLSAEQREPYTEDSKAKFEEYKAAQHVYKDTDDYATHQIDRRLAQYQDLKLRRWADPRAPKQPLSGYMLFSQAKRAEAVEKVPPGSSAPVVARQLGQMWKDSEDTIERAQFETEAEQSREQYLKGRTDYELSPGFREFQLQRAEWTRKKAARLAKLQQELILMGVPPETFVAGHDKTPM